MKIAFGPELSSRSSRLRRDLGGGLSIRLGEAADAAALGTRENLEKRSDAKPGPAPDKAARPAG